MLLFYTRVLEFLNVYISNSLHEKQHSFLLWRICLFFFLSTPFTLYPCVLAAGRSCATHNVKLSIFSDLWPRQKSLTSAWAPGAGQKPTSCLSVRAAVCHGELGAADGDPQWWDDGLCPASCQRYFQGPPNPALSPRLWRGVSPSMNITPTLPSHTLATTCSARESLEVIDEKGTL